MCTKYYTANSQRLESRIKPDLSQGGISTAFFDYWAFTDVLGILKRNYNQIGGNTLSIFTHFLAAMLGGTFGVCAMAFLIAGKEHDE